MTFEMVCPKCGYHYWVNGDKYEVETCPMCNYKDKFDSFILRQLRE